MKKTENVCMVIRFLFLTWCHTVSPSTYNKLSGFIQEKAFLSKSNYFVFPVYFCFSLIEFIKVHTRFWSIFALDLT